MGITRRRAVAVSTGMTLAAAGVAMGHDRRGKTSDVERYEQTPAIPGVPRISYAVTHGGIVYVAGVTAALNAPPDVAQQTQQVLARIDGLLAKAGTDKSRLLTATVWLTDMELFAAHNDAWNRWVDHANAPTRACLLSPRLWRPGLLVEIMVTAAAKA